MFAWFISIFPVRLIGQIYVFIYLAQRELFVELSDKSKREKSVIFFLLETSKLRPEMTRCSVALGKEWESNIIILDITCLKREIVKVESILNKIFITISHNHLERATETYRGLQRLPAARFVPDGISLAPWNAWS